MSEVHSVIHEDVHNSLKELLEFFNYLKLQNLMSDLEMDFMCAE